METPSLALCSLEHARTGHQVLNVLVQHLHHVHGVSEGVGQGEATSNTFRAEMELVDNVWKTDLAH